MPDEPSCNFMVDEDGSTCGDKPVLHVMWDGDCSMQSFVCAAHVPELEWMRTPYARHEYAGACGLPGYYSREFNLCLPNSGLLDLARQWDLAHAAPEDDHGAGR